MAHIQGEPVLVPAGDGRELYAQVLPGPGTGPAVVFEAGAAASRSTWALVQPLVGEWARAIVYDRSGLGRSAPDPRSRTLRRMADDLGRVLDHFEPGPFILVGHSAGGPIVRVAAADRPERITGLVLVDPTDEAADVLFSPGFRKLERVAIKVNLALAHTGLLGVAYRGMAKALPADAARDVRREGFTAGIVRTHAQQARTFLDELAAFREDTPELGELPTTVISGKLAGGGMNARLRAAANASHAFRVAQSPRGRHVFAERSGHHVPVTEPEVIADAIRRMVDGGNRQGG
ncbi:alpha/beta fold hydrolase [Kibdelosporangium phytohabitans]|uniref:Alpha/beta hydrolase n=1 Tax=Kibdelosporangium phytohabitans TaxID=860235 RepID=A0A0N9I2C9_9PSEU|nr:alpha/beta hydrolase [Kibdelosporangium phytohabitans]ALG08592.1 alpha/beta hydrolase [Kibdelosporangium phytohabitans]MBE1470326.1 pimeloyl-ACP methyl ester carboxylesterase [Kibdelosporangium phytohabitans]